MPHHAAGTNVLGQPPPHATTCCPSPCCRVAGGLASLSPPLAFPMLYCSSPTAHALPEGSKTVGAVTTHMLSLAPGLRFGHQKDGHPRTLSEPLPPGLSIASFYRACTCREYRKIKRPFLPTARLPCCPPCTTVRSYACLSALIYKSIPLIQLYAIFIKSKPLRSGWHTPPFRSALVTLYCPRANLIERVFSDVPDTYTGNHKRKRLRDLVKNVAQHVQEHGPGRYNLSRLYQAPAVTPAVDCIAAEAQTKMAA
jgi:hypothetical protein